MLFKETSATSPVEIFANDDWAAVPHKFTADAKAGDIVEKKGVVVYDVTVAENPNGAVAYRGVIDVRKLETSQIPTSAQITAFPMIKWLDTDGTFKE